jgi:hypothetical protein
MHAEDALPVHIVIRLTNSHLRRNRALLDRTRLETQFPATHVPQVHIKTKLENLTAFLVRKVTIVHQQE